MMAMLMVVIIAAYEMCFSTSYVINGSPPSPAVASPAVYMCQSPCSQKCAPECLPSCCNVLQDEAKNNVLSDLSPGQTASTPIQNQAAEKQLDIWNSGQSERPVASFNPSNPASWESHSSCGEKLVENTPAQRQPSTKPDISITSIEEGEMNECEDKGFNSPTDDSADPPGTITIPLPPTLYTPPRAGDCCKELPLPEFRIPASIFEGKFPKESMKLSPVDKTNASPCTQCTPPQSPPLPSPPPPPPPPPPTPSIASAQTYPIYPKLPPVTVSEIPVKNKVKPLPSLPLVKQPEATLTPQSQSPQSPIQVDNIATSQPFKFGTSAPASMQTSSIVLSPPSVGTPPVGVPAAANIAQASQPFKFGTSAPTSMQTSSNVLSAPSVVTPPVGVSEGANIAQASQPFGTSAPASMQTSSNILSAPSVVTPSVGVSAVPATAGQNTVQPVELTAKTSVHPPCEQSSESQSQGQGDPSVVINTSCDPRCEDPEEYECMVKEMKLAIDTKYPEMNRRQDQ